MQVIGDGQWQAHLGGQAQELLVEPALFGQAVLLELEVEVVRTEDVAVASGDRAGEVPVVDLERLGDLAAEAGAEADEALAVPGQVLLVDAWLVVVAVDVSVGHEAAQVLVAAV